MLTATLIEVVAYLVALGTASSFDLSSLSKTEAPPGINLVIYCITVATPAYLEGQT